MELKIARIGNSRGVRLPAATLDRYRIGATVVMEERTEGIMLRPQEGAPIKLSWEETAREMAAAAENWNDLEAADADGLDSAPWEADDAAHVAESPTPYRRRGTAGRSR